MMGIPGNCAVILAVGLVFLSLCSTGRALECYTCNGWMSSKCETKQECASPNNACMKVTRSLPAAPETGSPLQNVADGSSQYGCRVYDKCTIAIIKQELQTENIELRCCQSALCNGSFMASPATALILTLAAALLVLSS